MQNVFENRIGGIEKLTLIDYEGHLACILFYNGCNLKCPYCYNIELALGKANAIASEEIKSFLRNRAGKLDAVVFSGGECTVHGENLKNDVIFAKSLGYKVKIDTNGSNPALIKNLIEENLVDYIALDYKAPDKIISKFTNNGNFYNNFKETLKYLINQDKIRFEVRTTVHTDVTNESDIAEIIEDLENIGYKGNYYIQFFFSGPNTIGNVNQHPRKFDKNKISARNNITILFRNE